MIDEKRQWINKLDETKGYNMDNMNKANFNENVELLYKFIRKYNLMVSEKYTDPMAYLKPVKIIGDFQNIEDFIAIFDKGTCHATWLMYKYIFLHSIIEEGFNICRDFTKYELITALRGIEQDMIDIDEAEIWANKLMIEI